MEKPRRVNPDTYIITTNFPAGPMGILPINWYLLQSKEPVLVDTGMPIERQQFLTTLGSLIDPAEIRWIFLTHDDNDHAGNLAQAMEAAPNARVVIPFIGFARLADSHELPMDRVLIINPGQSFSVGDRELTVMRPPTWDSPATHGLYDPRNSTLFVADALGAFIPEPAEEVADVPEEAFLRLFSTFASALSPWIHLVDQGKFDQLLYAVRDLGPETILSSHGPVARDRTEYLLKALSAATAMEPFVGPDHDEMLAMMAEAEPAGVSR